MPPRSHLHFKNPVLGVESFRYKGRFSGEEESEEQQPDYSYLSDEYGLSLRQFRIDRERRVQERTATVVVPAHLFHVDIEFFGWFDSKSFENYYRQTYGLSAVRHYEYNTKVLFSIADDLKFAGFIEQIELFISTSDHVSPRYDTRIKYIKSFRFLSTEIILEDFIDRSTSYLNLVDSPDLFQDRINPIQRSLQTYLANKKLIFSVETLNRTIELQNVGADDIREIVRNFDIIHSVNSTSFGVIRPSIVGLPRREYPFTITSPGEGSLIVGVIDTGVSIQTPLSSLVINTNNDFGANGSDPRIDAVDHGTAVAAFVSLGSRLSTPVAGAMTADARILSIKILNTSPGSVQIAEVERLIRKAHNEVGLKLYVLSINFTQHLKNDSSISSYAYLLDKLSYELDILIFISAGNNYPSVGLSNADVLNYPNWFLDEDSNICPPADSMNNLTIGAIGSNLEPERIEAITIASLPAIYTRKYHINYEKLFQKNKHLFKPDIVFCGGNYETEPLAPIHDAGSALNVLSADRAYYFMRNIGTSYSGPLIANFAAQILTKYPTLKVQTVKALILNSAEKIVFSDMFSSFSEAQKRFVVGTGRPDLEKCLYSSDNEVTFIIEDSIIPGNLKSFELTMPDYLNDLTKDIGLVEVTATLCFKFDPLLNNHLAYCPIHIGFGLFKNVEIRGASNYMNNNSDIAIKKGLGWSQDAFYKSKIYSNSQKVRFTLSRSELLNENNKFKIAVNSKLHSILAPTIATSFNRPYEFSLAIRIKEQLPEARLTNQLYDELQLVNTLTAIAEIGIELESEAEI